MIYLDSSVLLHDYLIQRPVFDLRKLWDSKEEIVSSFVLVAEVAVVLRRAFRGKGKKGEKALEKALMVFEQDLERISIFNDASEITEIILKDPRFSKARTLDAFHAASAYYLWESSNGALSVLTADKCLQSLCGNLGLNTEFLT